MHHVVKVQPSTVQVNVAQMFATHATAAMPGSWMYKQGAEASTAENEQYHASAKALLDTFERICSLNTHLLYAQGYESPAQIQFATLPLYAGLRPPKQEIVTAFQSCEMPSVSLSQLVDILHSTERCTWSECAAAIILITRYCTRIQSKPTLHQVHRLFVAGLQLVSKTLSDRFPRNDKAAQFCGIGIREFNSLERSIVEGCEWQVIVHAGDTVNIGATIESMSSNLSMVRLTYLPASAPITTCDDLHSATPSTGGTSWPEAPIGSWGSGLLIVRSPHVLSSMTPSSSMTTTPQHNHQSVSVENWAADGTAAVSADSVPNINTNSCATVPT